MEQSLNFEMLRSQWPELAELACMAERYVPVSYTHLDVYKRQPRSVVLKAL